MGGPLNLTGIFRGEETADALCQSLQGVYIQGVRSAEGMQDPGLGASGLLVPDVMGKLHVGHAGAVLVLSGDRSDIHAYSHGMFHLRCQVYYDMVVCLDDFHFSGNPASRFQ